MISICLAIALRIAKIDDDIKDFLSIVFIITVFMDMLLFLAIMGIFAGMPFLEMIFE